jgi:hypothetical protein
MLVREVDGRAEYIVVRKFNQAGQVFFKQATSAIAPKPEVSFMPSRIDEGKMRKVTVDPIGCVWPAND